MINLLLFYLKFLNDSETKKTKRLWKEKDA